MDIEKAEDKVEKASSFFTTLNAFIKKHPIWSLIILVILIEGGHLSWLIGSDDDSSEEYYDEQPYYEYEEGDYENDSIYVEQQIKY